MKRVLWVSRHKPIAAQKDELRKLYQDQIEIDQFSHRFRSVEQIVDRYHNGQYDDMVIVAPMYVISKLTESGIHPLWCQMEQVPTKSLAQTSNNGRHYKFSAFKRVKELRFEFYSDPRPNLAA